MSIEHPPRSLEISSQKFCELANTAMKRLAKFMDELDSQPVDFGPSPEAIRSFQENLPEDGAPFEELLKKIFDVGLNSGINFPSAGYQCYIAVGGVFESAIAELIANVINRWPGQQAWSPGLVEMERTVVRWLAEILGIRSSVSGILTSGGSLANFSAVVTARTKILEPQEILQGVLYTSEHAHHSIRKAAVLAGFPSENVRIIPSGKNCKMLPTALKDQIQKDHKAGLKPFLVVPNAGTTGTGAMDPLNEIAAICHAHNLWLHVDAAWAGGFAMLPTHRHLFSGIDKADSITFDPHKALFLPFGCGALIVKNEDDLRRAHSINASYLPSDHSEEYNPSHLSPELSRVQRGLQVWLPIKLHGIKPFREYHQEKWELTQYGHRRISRLSEVEILCEPETAIVVFRKAPKGMSRENTNTLNESLLNFVNADRRIKISGTTIDGVFWQRYHPFGLRTHKRHVDITLSLIEAAWSKY